MKALLTSTALLALLLLAGACGTDPSGESDGGKSSSDAGGADGGSLDAGATDGGVVDSGVADGGVADGGAADGGELNEVYGEFGFAVSSAYVERYRILGVDVVALTQAPTECHTSSSELGPAWVLLYLFFSPDGGLAPGAHSASLELKSAADAAVVNSPDASVEVTFASAAVLEGTFEAIVPGLDGGAVPVSGRFRAPYCP
jgi:hypothetical protein